MSTLDDRLGALRDKFGSFLKPEITEQLDRHTAELRSHTGATLKGGDKAPTFALSDQNGKTIASTDLLKSGPLVVSFFRGTWCPYCNEELTALAASYADFRATGAELVMITPQSSDNAKDYLTEHRVPFSVLVDSDAKVAEAFGLAYDMPQYMRDIYTNAFGNDLTKVNDAKTWRLTIPGRFIIAQDGTITSAEFDADYRFRPEVTATLATLQSAKLTGVK